MKTNGNVDLIGILDYGRMRSCLMFGISSFISTNFFRVKYSGDGKSQGCWVGMSIANKITSGLMIEKPESADTSKSMEYVLYKVWARP